MSFHQIIICLVISLVASTPLGLGIKTSTDTDTVRLASQLDVHLGIDSEWRLRKKLRQMRDDFKFPILNFPFICSNIPTAPINGIYISQYIRYSRACDSYQDIHDMGLLLTRKLLNKGFQLVKLKSSLLTSCGCHCDLVYRYRTFV